jgi:hypothetical protein
VIEDLDQVENKYLLIDMNTLILISIFLFIGILSYFINKALTKSRNELLQEIEKYEQEFIPQSPQESWEDLEADVHQETKPTPKVEEKPKSKGRPKKK